MSSKPASKSSAKTDAWMPLWIGAYLADTLMLTTIQHGAYFLLLMAYWRMGSALPDDDDQLRSIVKADRAEWKKLRPVLEKFFVVADGVWWHKRVEAELAGSQDRLDSSKARAKAAANARWKGVQTDASSNAQASQNKPLKHAKNDAPSNARAYPQALPEDMLEECPTSHTNNVIGIPTHVAKDKNSVCVESAHTQIPENFQTHIRATRPELDAAIVWANFQDHYPPEKRTPARWQQWVKNERTAATNAAQALQGDPDSKASWERRGVACGVGKFDVCLEQWPSYKDRVQAAERAGQHADLQLGKAALMAAHTAHATHAGRSASASASVGVGG